MASPNQQPLAAAASLDSAVGFALPSRHARGRLVRLGPVLEEILSAHAYPAPIARVLGEALVLTALLGATLKDVGGQLTLQAQTESGIVDLLVADYRAGELRGYVRFDRERLASKTAVNWEEDLKVAASSSALLVPLLSPNYLSSTYCSQERDWFATQYHVQNSCPFCVAGWRDVGQNPVPTCDCQLPGRRPEYRRVRRG